MMALKDTLFISRRFSKKDIFNVINAEDSLATVHLTLEDKMA
uniref:Alternative protein ZNF251 n=1 Tax=Homo sapiens TaxID=9606 RepID=L0R6U9_HUMAN|nr:alternative protein ZNF251 [Homo sapiens]